jgi:copper chaperone CopZ
MKTVYLLLLVCAFTSLSAGAQSTSQKFAVSGNCAMCKKTIETAAKRGGASFASWDVATRELSIRFDTGKTSPERIRAAVAGSGYDTPGFKAPDAAYGNLHDCCKYERTATALPGAQPSSCEAPASKECCKGGICTIPGHMPAAGAKVPGNKAIPACCVPSSL